MVIFHSYVSFPEGTCPRNFKKENYGKLLSCKGAKAPTVGQCQTVNTKIIHCHLCVSAVGCPNRSNNLRNFCPPHVRLPPATAQRLERGASITCAQDCGEHNLWHECQVIHRGRSLGRSPTRWGILETFPGFRHRYAPEKLDGTPLKEMGNFKDHFGSSSHREGTSTHVIVKFISQLCWLIISSANGA